ncbi:MAG: helix-turn-helix domain-containing protein [Chitinispirillaceae bacterium]|nr:helix-turn-helix domain-containing protein [Chitinispirillaceae bacterium]
MNNQNLTTEYLTARELALLLNVSQKFIQSQTQARRIPGQIKVGRVWRYNRAEVEKSMLKGGQFLLTQKDFRTIRA